ncbi:MAG: DUF2236 domain-containing protein [Phototrophicales bacterium]|nr:MAG: DUF2236 domain-containing protein [Phototrophicales bacterium]RMG76711.1 MAG: DUF2236 domain-containing protein [Chloroflexota bacterium]
MSRYAILEQIKQLDPVKDHHRIIYLAGAYETPWLTTRALEFALFRTYAVPSIAKLLDQTGQFYHHGQRRYDDTAILIAEITEHGYDSERGRAALRRMNQMHGRYRISNDDFLYVLSTFIFEPLRWTSRFGWRQPIQVEKEAMYYFWREVGKRMNIKNIPPSYEAFEQFNIAYEQANFCYSDASHRVAEATIQVFLSWYPAPLRPLIREAIYALMDDPLRWAFGFPKPATVMRIMAEGTLKLYGKTIRWMPARKTPYLYTQHHRHRSYPTGYQLEKLGVDHR